jgi:hypothetical protein
MENKIRIEIPDYLNTVLMSAKRMKKYYVKGKKDLPKKYLDKTKYDYKEFKSSTSKEKKLILINLETKEKVIANPKVHGTEKWKVINGQKIYNGEISKWDRAKMVNTLKVYFKELELFKGLSVNDGDYPVAIFYTFYDTFQNDPTLEGKDLDNHAYIYGKCFQDVLVSEGVIQNDTTQFVSKIQYEYIESEKRKLVIEIYGRK